MHTLYWLLLFIAAGCLVACEGSGGSNIAWDDDDSGDVGDDDDAGDDDMVDPPDIDVPGGQITINDAVVGQLRPADLVIRNLGTGDLEIRYIRVADSAGHVVAADDWSGTIPPDAAEVLANAVQATCIDPITVLGVVEISSNDPDEHKIPVDVVVNCIAVEPAE